MCFTKRLNRSVNINHLHIGEHRFITGSSGGMFLTDSREDADKVRKWSTQSREAAPWYQHEEIGYNYRMSNVIVTRRCSYRSRANPVLQRSWKSMHAQPIYRSYAFVVAYGNGRGQSNAYIDEGKAKDVGMDIFRRGLCLPSDNKMMEG